ncbi:MAG: hypothetical protein R8M45_07925 [Ghiorsea sp.]
MLPDTHHTVLNCHAFLSTMQEKIRLRQWQHLDQATAQFSSAMVDLQQVLEQQPDHTISQQDLTDLSFQQRRITRMLHHAMLSNRNEVQEINLGLRHLSERKEMLA